MRLVCLAALACLPLPAEYLVMEHHFGGIECGSCAESLARSVRKMRGVEEVEVDAKQSVLRVRLAAGNRVRLSTVRDTMKSVGFTPQEARVEAQGQVDGGEFIVSGERLRLAGKPVTGAVVRLTGSVAVPADPRAAFTFTVERAGE